VHDYKTSASLPSDRDLRGDRQLTIYQMAVQRRFPEAREIRLIWHYLAFDQELTSSRTAAEVEDHRRRTIRLIDTIEKTTEFPPRESALCRWCDYRPICPVQKHLVAAEAAARAAAPPRPVTGPAAPAPQTIAPAPAPAAATAPAPAAPRKPHQMTLFEN
jgi:PD-(D/E)XK nuclease superfamily